MNSVQRTCWDSVSCSSLYSLRSHSWDTSCLGHNFVTSVHLETVCEFIIGNIQTKHV